MVQQQFTFGMTLPEWERLFPDDGSCKAYLTARRWTNGVRCPRCGNEKVSPVSTRPFHWQCTNCAKAGGYRFSVLVDTIFENTNIGLRQWFKVIYLMLASKKGISSLQIQRIMGFGSYKTALYMTRRIRAGLTDSEFRKLMGIAEVNEALVSGQNKHRHPDKPAPGGVARPSVKDAIGRGGNVAARVTAHVDTGTDDSFIETAAILE
ncbi:MAG TPA: IS1595 family transposase [Acetobacteraceae bacterium]|nr:IS1595 family transposase [Acetobacteraceae bacterium]